MRSLSLTFNNSPIHINHDAWFNATDMANAFGKKPAEWIRLPETQEYIALLCEAQKVGLSHLLRTTKGRNGATWIHRKLAIRFAQWLDTRFAIWCDERIEEMLSGSWQQERDDSKAYYRMMTDTLQYSRLEQGKETKAHHYINEAKLINYALTGAYDGIDRDNADKRMLSGIKRLESLNSALILMGKTRDERKPILWEKAAPYRQTALLEVAL